jgi:hypothetical protein
MKEYTSKFHYTDDKDMATTPEKAVRITLLSYDQNKKICERIDWIRDESNICKNCDTENELEITFDRTDGIIEIKKLVQGLLKDFKNKSSEYHDRRDLSQTLLNAIKLLDDSLARLYSAECDCDRCRRETDNDKR